MKTKRNSNIEILRIAMMFAIVAFHVSLDTFDMKYLSPFEYFTSVLLGSWGVLAVDVFVFISAWFLVDKAVGIRKIVSLLFQTVCYMLFYSVVWIIREMVTVKNIGAVLLSFSNRFLIGLFEPFFSRYYWFITAFLFMMLLSSLMNRIINSTDEKRLKKILVLLVFIPVFAQFSISPVTDIVYFLYLYLFIGYIKKYQPSFIEKIANTRILALMIISVIIARTVIYFLPQGSVSVVVEYVLINTFACIGRHSIIMLFTALSLFFTVIKLKPSYNETANKLASYSLGVYLFHEACVLQMEKPVKTIVNHLISIGFLQAGRLFAIKFILTVMIIYILGTAFEIARKALTSSLEEKILNSSAVDKISDYLNEE